MNLNFDGLDLTYSSIENSTIVAQNGWKLLGGSGEKYLLAAIQVRVPIEKNATGYHSGDIEVIFIGQCSCKSNVRLFKQGNGFEPAKELPRVVDKDGADVDITPVLAPLCQSIREQTFAMLKGLADN